MADLISKLEARKFNWGEDYEFEDGFDCGINFAINKIKAADIVAVTRCKNCRYAIKVKDTGIPDLYLCRAETNPNYKSANGFCDSGTPREDREKDDGR